MTNPVVLTREKIVALRAELAAEQTRLDDLVRLEENELRELENEVVRLEAEIVTARAAADHQEFSTANQMATIDPVQDDVVTSLNEDDDLPATAVLPAPDLPATAVLPAPAPKIVPAAPVKE